MNIMLDDVAWMRKAIKLAWKCPRTDGAFAVGAVLVAENGDEIAFGYSRETDSKVHAEESAINKVSPEDSRLPGATMYSTLEPCSQRASRPKPCSQLIIESKIRRVVIAWREPDLFVKGVVGVENMEKNGIEVVELKQFAKAALAPNSHLNLSHE